ncbi:serine hydrolase domain-containing protein [Stutzerimonas stutzeri]|uniref:serine hydrolase domain-containing protein n=1 Tax=Stutzerimonas stutzeri TaxID=316 RepID=UPI002109CDCD|nr:serine hydrolase [Stutzerimonas stutzeri]MCQ4257159.1 beta-lactamase family protein [Stutzerimonas stutzeri]
MPIPDKRILRSTWYRRALCVTMLFTLSPLATADSGLATVLEEAERLAPLETLIIAQHGKVIAERGYRGHRTTQPSNIKSASKSVISALVGIAIDKGVIKSVDQPIAELLPADLPGKPDPRLHQVTIGNLLTMQAGLGSTSGRNYGAWVASRNWVRAALARPFEADPGTAMIYSTGSSHLLSAILTRRTGKSTLQLARQWLAPLDGFAISAWTRDPQGIYLGGNEMAMTPRSLLAFGELYRRAGLTASGERLLSQDWIEASWTPRTRSRYTGHDYGYGWFITELSGEAVRYGWGYGGQMVYVVPSLKMTVVMTSNTRQPSSGAMGHRDALHRLLGDIIDVLHGRKQIS